MKVGVDGNALTIPFPCGTKHYAEQLIKNLARIDDKNEYIIFSKKNVKIPKKKNFKFVKIPPVIPILKRQYFLTYFAKKEGVDVFHYPDPYGSVFSNNLKTVTTVHDLDLKTTYPSPKNLEQLINKYNMRITRYFTFANTSQFISVSKSTKKQLLSYFHPMGGSDTIQVIYEAPHERFKRIKNANAEDKKFILCLGDFSPKKNVPRIIKAYSLLPKSFIKNYKLKIVVSTENPKKKFLKIAKDLGVEGSTEILLSPGLSKLIKLYNLAAVFAYPSLYEGFGLPILEAMACGCPVITSNRGSMKEVAGKAAFLVNPESAEDISDAILKIVKNKPLAKKLINKGFKRTKEFSWEKTARETLKIYKKLFKS